MQNIIQNKINYLKLLQAVVLVCVLLYFGSALFVPLSYALLISFILYPVCKWLELRGVPKMAAIGISLGIVILLLLAVVALLAGQALAFAGEWPSLRLKLLETLASLSNYLNSHFNISLQKQTEWIDNVAMSSSAQIFPFLQKTIYASAVSTVLFVLIPFYAGLILYYRQQLVHFLFSIFNKVPQVEIITILTQTITTFYNFIKGMLIVYLCVAILNSIGLWLIGIPHPVLFGVIASVLTFIPYFGIMVGALLPMAVSWITYDSVMYPLGVVAVFTVVQYLEANVIFPLAVSYRLQVNTLFTLIAIISGGIIWGASGMILFIPFLGILKLISDHSQSLKPISVLLDNHNHKPPKGIFKRKLRKS